MSWISRVWYQKYNFSNIDQFFLSILTKNDGNDAYLFLSFWSNVMGIVDGLQTKCQAVAVECLPHSCRVAGSLWTCRSLGCSLPYFGWWRCYLPQRSCLYGGHHEEYRCGRSRAVEGSLRRARLTQSKLSQDQWPEGREPSNMILLIGHTVFQ